MLPVLAWGFVSESQERQHSSRPGPRFQDCDSENGSSSLFHPGLDSSSSSVWGDTGDSRRSFCPDVAVSCDFGGESERKMMFFSN